MMLWCQLKVENSLLVGTKLTRYIVQHMQQTRMNFLGHTQSMSRKRHCSEAFPIPLAVTWEFQHTQASVCLVLIGAPLPVLRRSRLVPLDLVSKVLQDTHLEVSGALLGWYGSLQQKTFAFV